MKAQNNFVDRLLQNRVLKHTLFWLFILLMAPITSGDGISHAKEALIFRGVGMPLKMVATYLLVYYQIPKLLQKKKYVQFIVSLVISIAVISIAYRFNNIYIAETIAGLGIEKDSFWDIVTQFDNTYLSYAPRAYFSATTFLVLKMVMDRASVRRELDTLQKEKAIAELNFLKAQIHPHFLFNTLNNLYALTLDKSDQAPEVVAKLSEILDYILYQSRESKVLIQKEVELLENYIALEKLRYGDRLQLSFSHSLENPKAVIAPLILVSIVENAFKHGASGVTKDTAIEIDLEEKAGRIFFRVFNTKAHLDQSDEMNYKEGIGVKNVKRQLELTYPNRYTWIVDPQDETYEVQLTIMG